MTQFPQTRAHARKRYPINLYKFLLLVFGSGWDRWGRFCTALCPLRPPTFALCSTTRPLILLIHQFLVHNQARFCADSRVIAVVMAMMACPVSIAQVNCLVFVSYHSISAILTVLMTQWWDEISRLWMLACEFVTNKWTLETIKVYVSLTDHLG